MLLFVFKTLPAQEIPNEFVEKAETLVQLQPKTYEALDKELYPEKRDTTLLRYFVHLSQENDYLEGQAYALNLLGMKYRNISQYAKATMFHEQALAVSEKQIT